MARFINPFTDVGFKRIFGQEISKPLILDFLNSLLTGEEHRCRFPFQTRAVEIWRRLEKISRYPVCAGRRETRRLGRRKSKRPGWRKSGRKNGRHTKWKSRDSETTFSHWYGYQYDSHCNRTFRKIYWDNNKTLKLMRKYCFCCALAMAFYGCSTRPNNQMVKPLPSSYQIDNLKDAEVATSF